MSAAAQPTGLLIVVAAPSGAGKTSLVNALIARDSNIVLSISHTTRPRRPSEADGRDYHFVTQREFERMRAAREFLESAAVFGHRYGTSKAAVDAELGAGRDLILEIDWQGAQQVRERYRDAVSLFILPPSRAALIERLRRRGQDDPAVIAHRMAKAESEMSHYAEFDYLIVNDDFEHALGQLQAVVDAERLRTARHGPRLGFLLDDLLSGPDAVQ